MQPTLRWANMSALRMSPNVRVCAWFILTKTPLKIEGKKLRDRQLEGHDRAVRPGIRTSAVLHCDGHTQKAGDGSTARGSGRNINRGRGECIKPRNVRTFLQAEY